MAYALSLGSAAMFGAGDFLGGLASRRTNPLAVVVASQAGGLLLLVLMLPLLPEATPAARDLVWGGVAGPTGGIGHSRCAWRRRSPGALSQSGPSM